MPIYAPLFLALLALAPNPAQSTSKERPFALMVGDPAPRLEVARWLKGAPVERFEPGRVYVVDFWATWSMPAVRALGHLSDLQERHASALEVIGVSVWEGKPEEVEPYVKRMSERMRFTVAMDDVTPAPEDFANKSRWSREHGVVTRAWMTAAGKKEEGLPMAFLVDQEGRIAWIGDPMALDQPLEAVLAGSWDLAREAEEYRQRMRLLVETRPILARLEAAQQRRDWGNVVGFIGELMALDPEGSAHLAGTKFQALLLELKQPEEAYAFAHAALTNLARDSVEALTHIAFVIAYQTSPDQAQLELGRTIATRADELARGENSVALDSLARLHFLAGDLELAIATEKLALGRFKDEAERVAYTRRLGEYEAARGR